MSKEILDKIYYNPSSAGGLGGKSRLINELRKYGDSTSHSEVSSWLQKQTPYTVHKDIRKTFPRNKIILTKINETFFTDLVDMQAYTSENAGYKYIITIIDGFSKFAWALPLKSKKQENVIDAFRHVFEQRRPENVSSDAGSEFNNKYFRSFLDKFGINYYVMRDNRTKCPIVERFNRTLKERMFRYFSKQGNHKYVDILDDLLVGYNNTWHRSIKMKPIDATPDKEKEIFHNLYGVASVFDIYKNFKSPNLEAGDVVRIQKELLPFRKGYLPKWSEETFTIDRAFKKPTNPMYTIRDRKQDEIVGRFYPQELQVITEPEYFRIEKIIKTAGQGNKKKHLVRWLGYTPLYDSWVADKELKNFQDVKQ